jgi:hypothetical protein
VGDLLSRCNALLDALDRQNPFRRAAEIIPPATSSAESRAGSFAQNSLRLPAFQPLAISGSVGCDNNRNAHHVTALLESIASIDCLLELRSQRQGGDPGHATSVQVSPSFDEGKPEALLIAPRHMPPPSPPHLPNSN